MAAIKEAEDRPEAQGKRTCRACLQEILPGDLTPAEIHLCQDCLGRRRAAQQSLRDQVSAQYVMLRSCKLVKPCLLQGLALCPDAFKERKAAEALATDLLQAGFPPEETYNLLRRAVPGIRSGKTWALLAEASVKGAWSCRELREKLGIDCQGCSLQYWAHAQSGLS